MAVGSSRPPKQCKRPWAGGQQGAVVGGRAARGQLGGAGSSPAGSSSLSSRLSVLPLAGGWHAVGEGRLLAGNDDGCCSRGSGRSGSRCATSLPPLQSSPGHPPPSRNRPAPPLPASDGLRPLQLDGLLGTAPPLPEERRGNQGEGVLRGPRGGGPIAVHASMKPTYTVYPHALERGRACMHHTPERMCMCMM